MKNYVTHEPNSISGVLRIGASQSFSQSHGPALLKGFVDEYSDIEISLTTDTSDRLVKLVKKKTSILLSSAATRNGPNPIFFWKMPRCT